MFFIENSTFQNLKACLDIAIFAIKDIKVKEHILGDPKYNYLFTVDTLNEMVVAGMPFRDAYKAVAEQLEVLMSLQKKPSIRMKEV